MAKYTVLVREVYISHMVVEADNERDAINRVKAGEGDGGEPEYSHDLDEGTWTVETTSQCATDCVYCTCRG